MFSSSSRFAIGTIESAMVGSPICVCQLATGNLAGKQSGTSLIVPIAKPHQHVKSRSWEVCRNIVYTQLDVRLSFMGTSPNLPSVHWWQAVTHKFFSAAVFPENTVGSRIRFGCQFGECQPGRLTFNLSGPIRISHFQERQNLDYSVLLCRRLLILSVSY